MSRTTLPPSPLILKKLPYLAAPCVQHDPLQLVTDVPQRNTVRIYVWQFYPNRFVLGKVPQIQSIGAYLLRPGHRRQSESVSAGGGHQPMDRWRQIRCCWWWCQLPGIRLASRAPPARYVAYADPEDRQTHQPPWMSARPQQTAAVRSNGDRRCSPNWPASCVGGRCRCGGGGQPHVRPDRAHHLLASERSKRRSNTEGRTWRRQRQERGIGWHQRWEGPSPGAAAAESPGPGPAGGVRAETTKRNAATRVRSAEEDISVETTAPCRRVAEASLGHGPRNWRIQHGSGSSATARCMGPGPVRRSPARHHARHGAGRGTTFHRR